MRSPWAGNTVRGSKYSLSLIAFLCLLLPLSTEADPGAPDSILVQSASYQKGEDATVDIWTSTDEWLTGMEITLTWDWDNLQADSFLFEPTRFSPSMIKGYTPHLNNLTVFVFPATEELISPGRLRLGTIYFSYPDSAQTRTVLIDTTTLYLSDSLLVRSNVFTDTIWPGPFIPKFQTAELTLNICCNGFTGNTNCDIDAKVNLADIARLIDRVYISRAVLCCEAAGNVNGDVDQKLNLADITRLVDHVYLSKRPTSPCL